MQGWVSFHRKIEEWEWYTDANTFRLFFHLVLKANHQNKKWRGIEIKRGEMVTSYGNLASELKLSVKQVRLSLDKLISTGEVSKKTTNKYTLVSVANYDLYQNEDKERANKQAIKGQSKGNQRATNNNDNNDNKKNTPPKWSEEDKEFKLSMYLFNHIKRNNPSHKKPNLQNWSNQMDYILRLDKRNIEEVKKVIVWCQNDQFWKSNILSPSKLREKYDQLIIRINSSNGERISTKEDEEKEIAKMRKEYGLD